MDWQKVADGAGALAPVAVTAWGILNRHWLGQMFVPKAVLAVENKHLKDQLSQQKLDNDRINGALLAEASGWRGAAQATDFTRGEMDGLIERLRTIEAFVPKFQAAIKYVGQLSHVIVMLETTLRDHHIEIPIVTPPIPDLIKDDILS